MNFSLLLLIEFKIAQNVIQFSIGLANASPLSASVSLNVKIQLHNSTISYNISAPISLENGMLSKKY